MINNCSNNDNRNWYEDNHDSDDDDDDDDIEILYYPFILSMDRIESHIFAFFNPISFEINMFKPNIVLLPVNK